MKFEKWRVFNFDNALRGMRNPMDSWDKSDSYWEVEDCEYVYTIGKNDLELSQKLIKAGSEHRKFLRQIMVSVDITAPRYWWTEFDTYKVGTVANSCSTMHRLTSKPITIDDFEIENKDFNPISITNLNKKDILEITIKALNCFIERYKETKDKRYWKLLIEMLPQSYLQKRTVTFNYEVLYNMYRQRKNHKLTEWNTHFVNWVKELPYAEQFILLEGENAFV